MGVTIVDQPEGGKVSVNGPKATVTVEGATPLDVNSLEARNTALSMARQFISKPGFSSQSGHYPVDPDGTPLAALQPLPDGSRFRQDFTFQEGM
jgi:hypothetical protein